LGEARTTGREREGERGRVNPHPHLKLLSRHPPPRQQQFHQRLRPPPPPPAQSSFIHPFPHTLLPLPLPPLSPPPQQQQQFQRMLRPPLPPPVEGPDRLWALLPRAPRGQRSRLPCTAVSRGGGGGASLVERGRGEEAGRGGSLLISVHARLLVILIIPHLFFKGRRTLHPSC
jgi:hypothetical protein